MSVNSVTPIHDVMTIHEEPFDDNEPYNKLDIIFTDGQRDGTVLAHHPLLAELLDVDGKDIGLTRVVLSTNPEFPTRPIDRSGGVQTAFLLGDYVMTAAGIKGYDFSKPLLRELHRFHGRSYPEHRNLKPLPNPFGLRNHVNNIRAQGRADWRDQVYLLDGDPVNLADKYGLPSRPSQLRNASFLMGILPSNYLLSERD